MSKLIVDRLDIDNSNKDLNHFIVLHGIGTDEKALRPFIQGLKVPGHYHFIRGPFPYAINGAAYFQVEFKSTGNIINLEQAEASLSYISDYILDLNVKTKVCTMGFSQGAIMSYALAFQYPDLIDAVVGLNGRVLNEFAAIPPAKPRIIEVNSVYGLYDEIQPIHYGKEAKEKLNLPWIKLDYFESSCAHEINLETMNFCRESMERFNLSSF